MQSPAPISIGRFHFTPGSIWSAHKIVTKGISDAKHHEQWAESDEIELLRKYGAVFTNDVFFPLIKVEEGLLFLDGGYGSSKTTYVITRLLVKCMTNKYFKCFYGRQQKTMARELHDNIVREIKRNGWRDEFELSEKPNGSPDILHKKSGNMFKLFGCDDDESLKGIDNPTDILVDEINQISFESFGMLLTRLRGSGYKLQMIGCFNNCDVYPDHWLVKYIYGSETPSDEREAVLLDALKKSNIVKHHSTYRNNYFQNPDAYYEKLRIKARGDKDLIEAYCNGEWGVRLNGQPFYKMFKKDREVFPDEIEIDGYRLNFAGNLHYNPNIPLHISFDENVNPYFPVLIFQLSGNNVYVIDEIAGKNPYNNVSGVCSEIKSRYFNHKSGTYIYGDATSKKDDVKMEKGKNTFTLFMEELKEFHPVLRKQDSNPNTEMRGNFINTIFQLNYEKIKIHILRKCKHLIEDLVHVQEDPKKDRGKGKDKKTEMVDGQRGVQKYGHFSDAFDYFMCEFFMWAFLMYQNGGYTHAPVGMAARIVKNSYAGKEKEFEEAITEKEEVSEESYYQAVPRRSRNGF